MRTERALLTSLRKLWALPPATRSSEDYTLLGRFGHGFAGFSKAGLCALVIPISRLAGPVAGRRAAGFELVAHPTTRCEFQDHGTTGPAAALICTDPDLRHAFAILALDVLARSDQKQEWSSIVEIVDEWQTLLSSQTGAVSLEIESGLWGELWFIAASDDVDRGCLELARPRRGRDRLLRE